MATKATQSTGANDAAGTTLAATAFAVQKGDVIVTQLKFESTGGSCTCADNDSGGSNTYTVQTTQDVAGALCGRTAWAVAKATNASLTLTWTSPSVAFRRVTVIVFRPATGATLAFQTPGGSNSAGGTSAAPSAGSITALAGAAACFVGSDTAQVFTQGSGWTALNSVSSDTFDEFRLGSTGSITGNASLSVSADWTAHVLAFVETSSSAPVLKNIRGPGKHPGPRRFKPIARGFPVGANLSLAIDTQGSITLQGQSITLALGLAVSQGSITVQGQSVGMALAIPLTGGSITIAGQSATFATSLAVSPGSITIQGQSVGLAQGLAVSPGSITIAGQSTALAIGLAVSPASITIDGQSVAVNLAGNLTLDVSPGSITIQGQSIALDLSVPLVLSIEPGSISIDGQNVSMDLSATSQPMGSLGPMSASIGWYDHRKKKIHDDVTALASESTNIVVSDEAETINTAVSEEDEVAMLVWMLQ